MLRLATAPVTLMRRQVTIASEPGFSSSEALGMGEARALQRGLASLMALQREQTSPFRPRHCVGAPAFLLIVHGRCPSAPGHPLVG